MKVFHPEYSNNVEKWQTSIESYNGMYATDRIAQYLIKKSQREPESAFQERKKVTEPMLHYSTAIDGLNGIMFNKDGETSRDWGELGDHDDVDTIAGRLWRNADGEGMNWNSIYKQASVKLSTTHKIWGMVDGLEERVYNEGTQQEIREKVGDATVHVLDPTAVINWFPSNGPLEEVIVKEQFDFRKSIDEFFTDEDVYVKYTLDGWERYRVYTDDDGTERKETVDSGEYSFYRTAEKREKILPIFNVEIPLPRPVGYLLAVKQKSIWNLESVRDFAVRALSFALLRITVNDDSDKEKISEALKRGANILWQYAKEGAPHDFISADSSWLSEAGNILEKKVEDFYHSAFKEYGDASRQRTATEIRLESQTGIEAFLALLVDSVDEFENQVLWRIEQIYFPDRLNVWGMATVERSRDFTPEDTDAAMDKMMSRVFGEREKVPLPTESIIEVIKKWADQNGIVLPDDSEIQKAIEAQMFSSIPDPFVGS
jgi:hypothetical protein